MFASNLFPCALNKHGHNNRKLQKARTQNVLMQDAKAEKIL